MLFYLMGTFAPRRLVRFRVGNDMFGVRDWLDDLGISKRNDLYNVWSSNVNRVRGEHLCNTSKCGCAGGE
jgi:hypothetical protein